MINQFLAAITSNDFEVPKPSFSDASFATILQLVLGIAGAVAVIIFIIAGLKYTMSQGDPAATAKAKNTIINAAIGIVIIMSAFIIVKFVVKTV